MKFIEKSNELVLMSFLYLRLPQNFKFCLFSSVSQTTAKKRTKDKKTHVQRKKNEKKSFVVVLLVFAIKYANL